MNPTDDTPRSPARRVFLHTIAAGATVAALPACPGRAPRDAGAMDAGGTDAARDVAPPNCDGGTRFFSDDERAALDALGDYVLPPDARGPGASGLGLVPYIEQLLTAFDAPVGNPKIFAGGPFSNRNPFPAPLGGVPGTTFPPNDFANFLPLGRVQTIAWKLRILGSAGVPGGGPNDAVSGAIRACAYVMKNGACQFLALLAGRAIGALSTNDVGTLWRSLDPHFTAQMLQFVAEAPFSAPEYGGNPAGAGWQMIHFEGDAQPLGFSIYDPMGMAYHDRPGAPSSVANPGPDPDPFDSDTRNTIAEFTRLLGGKDPFDMSFNDPVGNRALTHFDALVIGSGAGGAPMAWMLTHHGLNVLVLEAGPNWLDGLDDPDPTHLIARYSNDELKFSNRFFLAVDPLAEPRTYRKTASDGARTYTGEVQNLPKHVGGAAMHADVKCPRFLPQDFTLGTSLAGHYPGANFADWPVTYDQLEPFYGYAERLIGVQGDPTMNPFEPHRSTPYPMPPGAPMYGATLVGAGAASLGYHPYPYPTAVNSRPYDGRPPCNDCGFCSGWACPIHAKGGPGVTSLRKALLSGRCLLLPETRAVRLVKNGAGNAITAVEAIGPDGARQTYSADRCVLAASPIETTRLLLLSDPGGPGVGNSSGYVGRNIMFHMQTVALGMWDQRLHGYRGRTVTNAITDFRGDVTDLANHPLAGITEIGAGAYPIEEAMYYAQELGNIGLQFKNLMRQESIRDHAFALTLQAEDAPQMTNRIDLDPDIKDVDGLAVPRLTYDHHAFELTARDFYGPKLLDILQAAGARYCALAPLEDISSSAHVMGTTRMGTDPASSVCDATGRFHDVGNLYASDGSLFPTSSGFNPILTITALSSFVAANIVSPGSPESALT